MDFLETIVLAFIIFILVDTFVMQPHVIRGDSMLPNFHTGERIFTEKISYRFHDPQRGDVVVFRYPLAPINDYIKRIIGLPGEELEIKDGKITVFNSQHPQGFLLNEPYLAAGTVTQGKAAIPDGVKFKVPEGQYLVMGDNRSESSDSREWGPVPKANLVGRVFLRYWPPSALSIISGFTYQE